MVPPGVAKQQGVSSNDVERWSNVLAGKIGKIQVTKKGKVFFQLGNERFQAFPGVERRATQQLIQLTQSKKNPEELTLYRLGQVEKAIILVPVVLVGNDEDAIKKL